MYYCFLEDSGFYPEQKIDLGNIKTPEYGYLGNIEESYFTTKATLLDKRSDRITFTGLENNQKIKVYFDQDKVDDGKDLFSVISDDNYKRLFYILEYIYLNPSQGKDRSTIETDLAEYAVPTSSSATSNNLYYLKNSCQIQYAGENVPYYYTDNPATKIKELSNITNISSLTTGNTKVNNVIHLNDTDTWLQVKESPTPTTTTLRHVPASFNNIKDLSDIVTTYVGTTAYRDLTVRAVNYFSFSVTCLDGLTIKTTVANDTARHSLTHAADNIENGDLVYVTDTNTVWKVINYNRLDTNEGWEEVDTTYEFKVYLSRQYFLDTYPLSTIVRVILPVDHEYILDPSKLDSKLSAVIQSSYYSFSRLDERKNVIVSGTAQPISSLLVSGLPVENDDITKNNDERVLDISTTDNSGMLTYYTKYVISSESATMLPFGILYKGAVPNTSTIRKAIREELLRPGIAPESVWQSLLPDLFIIAQFYIVPIYDHKTTTITRTMYPSVINYKKLKIFKTMFGDYTDYFINKYQEILICGQSEVFMTSLPDPNNETDGSGNPIYSIYTRHPTYQYHTSQDAAYVYQDNTTKEFNKMLNRTLAIAHGEAVVDAYTQQVTTDNGYKYLVFSVDQVEYYVLTKETYDQLFPS